MKKIELFYNSIVIIMGTIYVYGNAFAGKSTFINYLKNTTTRHIIECKKYVQYNTTSADITVYIDRDQDAVLATYLMNRYTTSCCVCVEIKEGLENPPDAYKSAYMDAIINDINYIKSKKNNPKKTKIYYNLIINNNDTLENLKNTAQQLFTQ